MSKGSVRWTVRVPAELLKLVQWQIAQRNAYSSREPWSESDWIRVAMEEKLKKMQRSRNKKKK